MYLIKTKCVDSVDFLVCMQTIELLASCNPENSITIKFSLNTAICKNKNTNYY